MIQSADDLVRLAERLETMSVEIGVLAVSPTALRDLLKRLSAAESKVDALMREKEELIERCAKVVDEEYESRKGLSDEACVSLHYVAESIRALVREEPEGFRKCEFCGCVTNAKLRACCNQGRTADKDGWIDFEAHVVGGASTTAGGSQWISVADRLPKSGQYVLAFYLNGLGKGRRIRAAYYPKFSRQDEGYFQGDTEYDEATDEHYWPEGWYESNEHDETDWRVHDEVTHWMPLPPPPQVDRTAQETSTRSADE